MKNKVNNEISVAIPWTGGNCDRPSCMSWIGGGRRIGRCILRRWISGGVGRLRRCGWHASSRWTASGCPGWPRCGGWLRIRRNNLSLARRDQSWLDGCCAWMKDRCGTREDDWRVAGHRDHDVRWNQRWNQRRHRGCRKVSRTLLGGLRQRRNFRFRRCHRHRSGHGRCCRNPRRCSGGKRGRFGGHGGGWERPEQCIGGSCNGRF